MNLRFFTTILTTALLFTQCSNSKTSDEANINNSEHSSGITDSTMNVLLINGSPHKEGCTYTALSEVAKALNAEGIATEILWIGTEPIQGCVACGGCSNGEGCVFDDIVNLIAEKAKTADGFIFGSPVYYSGVNGSMVSVLNRLFYSAGKSMAYKPGAAVVSARRAGTTATLQQLYQYFTINNMPLVGSQYWCMVHGNKPEDVLQDKEGMQIMRTLGKNMAWVIKSLEAGKQAGISIPEAEPERARTNFIR
jgi:multimeric flavodoxin WrbA